MGEKWEAEGTAVAMIGERGIQDGTQAFCETGTGGQ